MQNRKWIAASLTGWVVFAAVFAALPGIASGSEGWNGRVQTPRYKGEVFPPWQKGENNDAVNRGFEFTVPEVNSLADFHGDITQPRLVLYVGGNYFFAMAPLIKAFEQQHAEYRGKIYWETIPPGLLVKQMKAGGTVTSGNMTWTAKPDAYFAGLGKVKQLIDEGLLVGPPVPYVTNTLTIMVPKGNPAKVEGLADLGKPTIRLAMPNPEFEGIARQIKSSLQKAGGDSLASEVYEKKVGNGSAVLTYIHHRQTPLFLIQGLVDAGVTWQSEAIFQEQVGHPISHVDIPESQNTTAIYAGAEVRDAPHPDAARAWLAFTRSDAAYEIFSRYGFKRYKGT
ncbi:MAG: substrate-binding domain-containing protein [Hyphomicrobiales bacterium]|nr:substrate-binding domain-containing protein [Hyphomicrobiales bacterium]